MNVPSLVGVDVGSPRLRGATQLSGSGGTITAGGEDIWNSRDEFHFAHVRVTGDFELSARLESLAMADVYTKAGLMLRASLADDAPHALLLAFGDNQPRNRNNGGLEFQYRETAGGPCTGIYPPQPLPPRPDFPVNFPAVWLKLIRAGDTLTGQFSPDGKAWRTFCAHRQALPAAALLGLAVTSHNVNRTVTAVFSDLALWPRG